MKKYTRLNANHKILIIVLTILLAVFGISYSPQQASSDDNVPPETGIQQILDFVENVSAISGNASDADGWIEHVEIQINRSDDSYFWNGSGWQFEDIWINASPVDGTFDSAAELWTINETTPLPTWVNGFTYYIKAIAVDNGSLPDPTPALESFTIGTIGWDAVDTGIGDDFVGVWGNSSSDIFIIGGDSTFETNVFLHYNGTAWNTTYNTSGHVLNNIWGSSSSDIFAVGSLGAILHYDGISWTPMESGVSQDLYGIWGNSSTNVFAVGINGTILNYNGSYWTNINSGTNDTLYSVWGNSSTDIFAVGFNTTTSKGTILHSNGISWTLNSSGVFWPLSCVWGSNSSDVFAAGLSGKIIHYNGSAWSNMSSGTTNTLRTIWGTSGSNVFAGGYGGTVLHYQGTNWMPTYTDTTNLILAIWGNTHDVYAVGKKGTLLHYNAYPDRSVYLSGPKSIAQGQNCSIMVGISRTTDLYTGHFAIEYNSSILRVISPNVSNGSIYGNTTCQVPTAGTWNLTGSGPGNQGKIEITFNLSNCTNPIGPAEGNLSVIYFNAISYGTTNLSFVTDSTLTNYYSSEIPINWYNNSIIVYKSRPPAITTLACSNIEGNHSAIHLTWTATGSGGNGSEYDIRYRPNVSIDNDNWDYSTTIKCTGEPQPNASPAIESFDVSGLDHSTKYYFAMKVADPGSYFSNLSNTDSNCTTPPWNHDLTLSANPNDGGTAVADGSSPYLHNSIVGINATPNGSCWAFVNWSGDTGNISNPNAPSTTVTILGNYSITANFAIKTYQLSTSSTTGGNATTPGEGTYNYSCGTAQNIIATADPCYHFVNWSGDTGNISNPNNANTTITMNGNYSITANFAINPQSLTTSSGAGGNVSTPGEGTYPYNCSQVVSIVATNDSCYHFVNWSGNTGNISNPNDPNTTITMNGNYSITANFAINPQSLTTSSGAGGNVSTPGEGSPIGTYNCGNIVAINATPDSCYLFVNWSGDTGNISNPNNANTTITMNGNYSITANFAPTGATYNLTINSSEYGNVSIPGEGSPIGTYNCSDTINLTAAADLGYEFVSWSGDTDTIANSYSPLTTIIMYDNYSITANFDLPPSGNYSDANNDDHINATDISYIKAAILGRWTTPNPGTDGNADGLITATDISYVKAYILGRWNGSPKYEVPFYFLSGTGSNKWAKINTISSNPPTGNFDSESGWTEASPTDYNSIAVNDSNVWTVSGTSGNYSALQCKFTIVSNPVNITSIGITLNGSSNINASTLRFYAWNFNTSSWRQLGTDFSITTNLSTYTIWSFWGKVYSSYVDGSDHMFILATLNTPAANLNIDYIKLQVAHP
jgi:hypothetical protein